MSKTSADIDSDFNIVNALALFARAAKLRPTAFWTLTAWTFGLNALIYWAGVGIGPVSEDGAGAAYSLAMLIAWPLELALYLAWTRLFLTGQIPAGIPFRIGPMEVSGLVAGLLTAVLFLMVGGPLVGAAVGLGLLMPGANAVLFIVICVLLIAALYASLRLAAAVSLSMLRRASSIRQTWERGGGLVLPIFFSGILLWLFALACFVLAVLVIMIFGLAEGWRSVTFAPLTLADPALGINGALVALIVFLFGYPAQLMGLSIPAYAAMAMADEPGEWWEEIRADEAEDEARAEAESEQ